MELLTTYVRISDITKSRIRLVPSETVIMMNHMVNTGMKKTGRLEKVVTSGKYFHVRRPPLSYYLCALCSIA